MGEFAAPGVGEGSRAGDPGDGAPSADWADETLRRFVATNVVGVVVARASGEIVEANDYYLRVVGHTRSELEAGAIDWRALTPPEWLPADERAIAQLRAHGRCDPYEKEYVRRDGSRVAILIVDVSVPGPADLIAGFLLDVTERHEAARRVRESDERFRAAFDATLDAMAIWEAVRDERGSIADFVLRYANRPWRDLNTPEVDDPTGILMYATFPADEARRDRHRRVTADREVDTFLARVDDGWREMVLTPFRDGFIVASRDVTARVEAEEALRDDEERWQFAVEGAGDGVRDWRVDTDERRYSATWKAMLGYAPEEIPDTHEAWVSRIHPDDLGGALVATADNLEGRTPTFVHEYRMRHRDGSWRWILARGRVVRRAPDGSPLRMVGTHTDVTEQRRLEAGLREAQRLESVGRLAGGVAHEFNNLLTAINGWAEILATETTRDDPRAAEIAAIREAGARAATLTHQLLSVGRRVMLLAGRVPIAEALDESLPHIVAAVGPGVTVHVHHDAPGSAVRFDPAQLRLIAIELATNAGDAMPSGGMLTISTSPIDADASAVRRHPGVATGRYVRVAFTDTGSGMDAAVRDHAFEPFFTTKRFGQGRGLGLATVEGIVAQSGGWVELTSEPGSGTTVALYLPESAEDRAASGLVRT